MASYSVNLCFEKCFERRYKKNKGGGKLLREIEHDVTRLREMYCSDTVLRIAG